MPRPSDKPLEALLPLAKRDEIRARVLAAAPSWYDPRIHLVVPSLFAVTTIAICLWLGRGATALEWLTVPITWLVSNANEWRVHKTLLHRPSRLGRILYEKHTPEHHRIYVTDDMAIREWREFHLVLIPAYGLFLLFVSILPVGALLGWLFSPNVACLYLATGMAYTASYEWLHLSYHLPAGHPIGKLALVRVLRRHHAIHHDPRLMQRWNFNVTIPFWDWVMGTIVRDPGAEAARAEEREAGGAVATRST